MVIVQEELTYIKDNWISRMKTAITNIQTGDDGTGPLSSDTAIGNLLDTSIIESLDESVADQLSWTSKFGITSYVGSTLREATLYDGTSIKSRDLTVVDVKSADEIHWVSITSKINAVNG